MSYRDPYTAGGNGRYPNNQPHYPAAEPAQGYYSDSQQPYRSYDNMGEDAYNPYESNSRGYTNQQQQYGDYGYTDYNQDNSYPPTKRQPSKRSGTGLSEKQPSVSIKPVRTSGFEPGEFPTIVPAGMKSRSPRALKEYRYGHQGNLWSKGGRGRCAGRVCCCTLMTVVFLIVSIVLSLALWIRPPSIQIGNVQTMTQNGNPIQTTSTGIQINMGVDISVKNPNYFSVDFKKIEADVFYPPNNVPVGGGSADNIVFKSNSQTNFTFPFSLVYNSTADPGGLVILDLAQKCGVSPGSTKTNINVNYKITLGIRIALVTISPVISNQFSFPCPLSASDISKFIGGGA